MDHSLPGSSNHGILQARVPEWGAIAFMANRWGNNANSARLFFWAPKSLQMVIAAMKLKDTYSLEESYDKTRQHIKKQRCTGMTQMDGTGREEGSEWGTRVYLWWMYVDIWQNQYNIVKLKKKKDVSWDQNL